MFSWIFCSMFSLFNIFCIFSKQHAAFLCNSHQAFLAGVPLKVQVVQPYYSTDTAIAWKNSFYQKDQISISSIAFHTFPMHMLTSLLVDEIFLPRYLNWSTNFSSLPLGVNIVFNR